MDLGKKRGLAIVLTILGWLALPATGQVRIENAFTEPVTNGIEPDSPFRAINPPVRSIAVRPRTTLPYSTSTQTQSRQTDTVYRARPVHDAKSLQAIKRMEQELSVIKTTKSAWMEFDADRIFNPGQSTIKADAKPLLDKIVNYLCLSCGKGISVKYGLASGVDPTQTGRNRTYALSRYFAEKSHLSSRGFYSQEPERLQHTSTVSGQSYPGQLQRRVHKSLVNIYVLR